MSKLKENPELLEQLEAEIREISGAVRRLLASNLNERAILVLVNDALPGTAGLGIRDIKMVLDAVANLDSKYLRKKIKP